MVTDPELNQADSNSLEVWAPVHAWQTLEQLGAASVSGALLNLLDDPENDWSHSEIPIVLGMMGAATLPDIQQYLADQTRDPFGRISAPTSLAEVGTRHPEARDQCLDLLAQQLAKKENDREFNGFLIAALCNLKGTEKAEDIKRAFAAKRVNLSIIGDWDEVQVQLGLKPRKEVPLRGFTPNEALGPISDILALLKDPLSPISFQQSSKKHPPAHGFSPQSSAKKGKKKKK